MSAEAITNEAAVAVRKGPLVGPVLGRVVVVDEGRGILPRADSPGLGLGLPLIATLAESLELGTGANEETEVRMSFRLDAVAGDDLRPR